MAANDAENKDYRYGYDWAAEACGDGAMPNDGKVKCNTGTTNWCIDVPTRIWNNNKQSAITSANVCYSQLSNLGFRLIEGCNNATDVITPFCTDIRKNNGTLNVKNPLNATLAEHVCRNDNNINGTNCSDVKTACSAAKAPLDDTTVPNYKCKTLVKALNSSNRIAMLNSTFPLLSATTGPTLTETEKQTLATYFNTSENNKDITNALCSLSANTNTPICTDYLSSNFKEKLQVVTDTEPVLIMYFNSNSTLPDKLFAIPNGTGKASTVIIPFTKPTTATHPANATATWFAKLYAYITPSTTDDYLFKVKADDNAKLYINNTLIVDTWGKAANTEVTASSYLKLDPSKGPYLLYIEYRDLGGSATLK